MKTSIITITYDRDLEYLKYNLQSIKKFCKGYHENIVVIDDHENDCKKTQEYLESIGQKYYINREAKFIKHGYIRQQYMGYYMDKYCSPDTEYVCCVDSDNIFTESHSPDVYFVDNLPVMGMQRWDQMPNTSFKKSTDNILKWTSENNFMRRMPLIYRIDLFSEIRAYLQNIHQLSIEYIFKDIDWCAEYCIWGDYEYKFHKKKYYWIDTVAQKDLWFKQLTLPCIQYSSKQNNPRYIDISDFKNILN
jgi:hypothetical protein